VSDVELSRFFAELARRLHEADSARDVLTMIVATAVEAVPGCDHASVSHRRGRQLLSESSNDEIGPTLDRIQSETQEGPCLDAIRTGEPTASEHLQSDPRWPSYGPRSASESPVRSSVAIPLLDRRGVIGALDLFADSEGTFGQEDDEVVGVAAILAAHAGPGLAAALYREDMQVALERRDIIGQAKGILMARSAIDADAAFNVLVRASQRLNVKLAEVAQRLVSGALRMDATDDPAP
jgi:GAF domain-containing protein